MYRRRSVKGVAVAKASAAALSKVAKPNGDNKGKRLVVLIVCLP